MLIDDQRAVKLELISIVSGLDGRFLVAIVFLELNLFLITLLLILIRVVTFSITFIKQLTLDISEMLRRLILIMLVDTCLRGFVKGARYKLRWHVRLVLTRKQCSVLTLNRLFVYNSL